jgi:hypothetical protein
MSARILLSTLGSLALIATITLNAAVAQENRPNPTKSYASSAGYSGHSYARSAGTSASQNSYAAKMQGGRGTSYAQNSMTPSGTSYARNSGQGVGTSYAQSSSQGMSGYAQNSYRANSYANSSSVTPSRLKLGSPNGTSMLQIMGRQTASSRSSQSAKAVRRIGSGKH